MCKNTGETVWFVAVWKKYFRMFHSWKYNQIHGPLVNLINLYELSFFIHLYSVSLTRSSISLTPTFLNDTVYRRVDVVNLLSPDGFLDRGQRAKFPIINKNARLIAGKSVRVKTAPKNTVAFPLDESRFSAEIRIRPIYQTFNPFAGRTWKSCTRDWIYIDLPACFIHARIIKKLDLWPFF